MGYEKKPFSKRVQREKSYKESTHVLSLTSQATCAYSDRINSLLHASTLQALKKKNHKKLSGLPIALLPLVYHTDPAFNHLVV